MHSGAHMRLGTHTRSDVHMRSGAHMNSGAHTRLGTHTRSGAHALTPICYIYIMFFLCCCNCLIFATFGLELLFDNVNDTIIFDRMTCFVIMICMIPVLIPVLILVYFVTGIRADC